MAGSHHREARPAGASARRAPRRRELAVVGALLLLTLAAYFPALGGAFLWDDDAHVTAPALRSLGGLARIWIDPGATQQYYPLAHSAFWLQYRLWGAHPVGYHVVNVVLHVACALLLWSILERLAVPGALLAAAIWALHPVNVESVAWITELKNTLSGVFYLAALFVYLRFGPPGAPAPGGAGKGASPGARDWRLYGVALALYVCALLSKTVTASLPAAILLIVWWKEGRLAWRRHVVPLVPFFAIGVPLGLTTAWLERNVLGAQGEDFAFTLVDRGLIAGRALWFYAGKLVWPADLVFIYPRWSIDRAAWWQYVYPVAAVAVVAGLWALRGRCGRGPLAAALFFAGTLFPALGFFNVYPFTFSFVADHFQYMASIGLLTLAAALIAAGLARVSAWRTPLGHALCAGLVLILAGLSWRQARIYGDVETLYRDTIARNPRAEIAYVNLGEFYWRQGRHGDAIEMYRAAVTLAPRHAHAYYNLGRSLAAQGQHADAITYYQQALAIRPDLPQVRQALGVAYNDLGLQYRKRGLANEAIAAYRAAIDARPDFAAAYTNLGVVYGAQGMFAEALAAWERAAQLEPNSDAGRAATANIQILRARLGR